jgi:hypothetical protein
VGQEALVALEGAVAAARALEPADRRFAAVAADAVDGDRVGLLAWAGKE